MTSSNYIAILAVSPKREFAKTLRDRLSAESDLDVVSSANTKELALASAAQCTVVLFDATTYQREEVCKMARLLRAQAPSIKPIAVFAQEIPNYLLPYTEAGFIGFCCVTDPTDRFVQLIHGAHNNRAYIAPDLVAQLIRRLTELRAYRPIRDNAIDTWGADPMTKLSRREHEVFELVGGGLSNRQIADQLTIEHGTVKNHVHKVLKKLGAVNRKEVMKLHALVATQVQQQEVAYTERPAH